MIAFRPATLDDRAFIKDTWLDSYRLSHSAGILPMNRWYPVMQSVLDDLLDKEGTRTIVAYEPEVESRFHHYGFISYNADIKPPCVYYVFVLAEYRQGKEKHGLREGVARQLFRAAGIDPNSRFTFACKTGAVGTLLRKIPLAKFNPLIARFENPRGD